LTKNDPLSFFQEVYGVIPEWVSKMNHYAPEALAAYTGLRNEIMTDGALSKKEKELLLVAINAARRYERSMIYHTKGAVDAGATLQELIEILAVCIISRGIPAWITGMEAIQYAAAYMKVTDIKSKDGQKNDHLATTAKCMEYYQYDLGAAPEWADLLCQSNPQVFMAYSNLRAAVLKEGVVSRKLKELILVGINVAERYPKGVKLHVMSAKKYGATDQEIAEVSLTALLTSGIPAWFEGSDYLK
jgi:alkylhydroperoxidase/carboxymuconolactone decarboxylase family protein YurZ